MSDEPAIRVADPVIPAPTHDIADECRRMAKHARGVGYAGMGVTLDTAADEIERLTNRAERAEEVVARAEDCMVVATDDGLDEFVTDNEGGIYWGPGASELLTWIRDGVVEQDTPPADDVRTAALADIKAEAEQLMAPVKIHDFAKQRAIDALSPLFERLLAEIERLAEERQIDLDLFGVVMAERDAARTERDGYKATRDAIREVIEGFHRPVEAVFLITALLDADRKEQDR